MKKILVLMLLSFNIMASPLIPGNHCPKPDFLKKDAGLNPFKRLKWNNQMKTYEACVSEFIEEQHRLHSLFVRAYLEANQELNMTK